MLIRLGAGRTGRLLAAFWCSTHTHALSSWSAGRSSGVSHTSAVSAGGHFRKIQTFHRRAGPAGSAPLTTIARTPRSRRPNSLSDS
jgi:hypothetical protein